MLQSLNLTSHQQGHPEWGRSGPNNAGSYNCNPCRDNNCGPFFTNGGDNYASAYGQFFLNWYSQSLVKHGNDVLSAIAAVSRGTPVKLAANASGIHWQYNTGSHGAELTAGYKNDRGIGYAAIARMFAANGVRFDFTCFEMKDSEQSGDACSAPQGLVALTLRTAKSFNVPYEGENALPRYDSTAYQTIIDNSRQNGTIDAFTYLRLGSTLFNGDNWNNFRNFVNTMKNL